MLAAVNSIEPDCGGETRGDLFELLGVRRLRCWDFSMPLKRNASRPVLRRAAAACPTRGAVRRAHAR